MSPPLTLLFILTFEKSASFSGIMMAEFSAKTVPNIRIKTNHLSMRIPYTSIPPLQQNAGQSRCQVLRRVLSLLIGILALSIVNSSTDAQTVQPPNLLEAPTSSTISLQEAIQLAQSSNPVIIAARSQLTEAEAAVDLASSGKHFQIIFNSTGSYSSASVSQPPPAYENFGDVQNSITVPLPVTGAAQVGHCGVPVFGIEL
jgi:hypothetical protein